MCHTQQGQPRQEHCPSLNPWGQEARGDAFLPDLVAIPSGQIWTFLPPNFFFFLITFLFFFFDRESRGSEEGEAPTRLHTQCRA